MVFPSGSEPVPEKVLRIAGGRPVRAVWLSEVGAVTFEIGRGAEYVKTGAGDFSGEAERLAWAADFAVVPLVLGVGDGWLHTAGLLGSSAVDPYWVARPAQAARAIGAGLRMLHDRLPVESCPWVRTDFPAAPPPDRLVVCHGDACAPNTLIDADGRCAGHVDLGSLGVADRWADLAIATMSLGWNYDVLCEDELLEAYGVERDDLRIGYYRRLWEAPASDGGYPR
jgi:kanamycin kinase